MDINTMWNSIITIKIREDSSYKFTLREIETFAKIYNIELEELCTSIFKFSHRQIYDLKNKRTNSIQCMEYKIKKQQFFEEKGSLYRLQIIKEKIKLDPSNGFDIEELKNISIKLNINLEDLCINILGISQNMLSRFKNGEFKKIFSKRYKNDKTKYFTEIRDNLLEEILNSKKEIDFLSKFSYDETMQYSNRFGINIRDFLGKVLEIDAFGKWNKQISKTNVYISETYKKFKHKKMQIIGNEILDSFIVKRMQKTGKHSFDKNEIEALSTIYHINARDFMVYVLGKSEQLYNDFKANRIKKCFSKKYKDKKEEIIIFKREKFMSQINPNIRNYYSWEELETLSSALGISTYDFVVNVMKKSEKDFSRISKDYESGTRVYVGKNKSGPLPKEYCQDNVDKILGILKIAVKSAIGYMSSNGYKCSRYYTDLLQEGYLYLSNQGNPINKNGDLYITSTQYQKNHGNILYKKVYFNAISNIKAFCMKEKIGEAYDVNIKVKGNTDNLPEDDAYLFITGLSQDRKERQVLRYFSDNVFCDETIKEACKIFKVNNQYIEDLFGRLKKELSKKDSSLEK